MQAALLSLLALFSREVAGEAMRSAVVARYGKADVRFSPGPTAVLMPRFVYVRDTGLELPLPPWQTEAAYAEAFEIARRGFASAQPDFARALMVITSFDEGGTNLFYVPLANDVHGLGETQGAQIFDDTPDSILDGYIWMGSLDRLEEAGDAYWQEAFLHEIAHRWGSYAAVEHPDLDRDELRGRQSTHWSFFLDRAGSPMDGNDWELQGNDAVTVFTMPPAFSFSMLDLYLMGVLPAEDVPPFFVIARFNDVSPPWLMAERSTPPAHRLGTPVTLTSVQIVNVSIDDVIAASGERVPHAVGRVVWPIAVVFLSNGFATPTLADFQLLDRRIEQLAGDFELATGGRMSLDLEIRGAGTLVPGSPCSSVDQCDRTRSDACASPHAGIDPICTRTCQTEAVCAPGQCCTEGVCTPSRYCGVVTDPGEDGGMVPSGMTEPHGSLVLEDDPGCRCSSTEQIGSPWWILLGLALSRARPGRRRLR